MPRLKCDTRVEKPTVDIVDRVFDLRNRVKWLKNVEYCLFGDQTDRLTKIHNERHDLEIENKTLREKMLDQQFGKNLTIGDEKECIDYHRTRAMEEHNQLLFIQRSLTDRLALLRNEQTTVVIPVKAGRKNEVVSRRIRDIQDRLNSVKLMNKTLRTCKQHLQCDLDLLGKELPSIQKEIEQKFNQKKILRKQFLNITTENKRHIKEYQLLSNQTEIQSRQRRAIHEQAMASVTEQLEDQGQVQMISKSSLPAVNDMATSFESRKFNVGTNSTTNLQQKSLPLMNYDEIIQVRCMHEQFYNMIMNGLPIDLATSEQSTPIPNDISAKITAMLTMTNRMMEEKEQVNEQITRTEKLLKLIEMSLNQKNDTRRKIVDTMIEQREKLDMICTNDIIDEQNRIIRQINDFIVVLSKILCRHVDAQSLNDLPTDFIERLKYLCDLIKTTIESETTDDDDHRSDNDENSRKEFSSTNSSLSSLSSRIKRQSPMTTNLY